MSNQDLVISAQCRLGGILITIEGGHPVLAAEDTLLGSGEPGDD
jgi:hypothetical protein